MNEPEWELVLDSALKRVRRFPVPGGWLYQVELFQEADSDRDSDHGITTHGWHPPVFVPGER